MRSHKVHDLRGFFSGGWAVTRRIADALLTRSGRFDGRAAFQAAPGGLLFDEAGTLRIGAHHGRASQRYVFALTGPTTAEVRFADGRLFHPLDLASGATAVEHRCGADRYLGRYRVLDGDRFLVAWRVDGPRKRLRLTTRFIRVADGDLSPAL